MPYIDRSVVLPDNFSVILREKNVCREEESKQEKANERQGIWKEAFEDQEESDPK